MPVIIFHGIPTETNQQDLELFSEFVRQRTAGIKELKIDKNQVSVFFPVDLMKRPLNGEIIIFVEDLFERPERTDEVRKNLAMHLLDEAHQSFPRASLIECIIRPLNPKQGFASGKIEEGGCFFVNFG